MQINSIVFVGIFLIILLLYYAVPKKAGVAFLAIVSIAFYAAFSLYFLAYLAVTVAITYIAGVVIEKSVERRTLATGMLGLTVLVIAGLFLLFRFDLSVSLIIPIGFSFYSLQALGYVIDVYRGEAEAEHNLLKYSLYVSFFPTVTAGPILRGKDFLRQIDDTFVPEYDKIRTGLLRIAYGLFLKNVVADHIAIPVNYAFDYYYAQSGVALFIGAILYAFQLYIDFSGYSHIAIGMAQALGFTVRENFRQPYFSKSVREFWNRWHISLSSWLKDYIYIPLGGSRAGTVRTALNIIIVFAVSGVWHGKGLNFIVWGLLHGGYRLIEYFAARIRKTQKEKKDKTIVSLLKMLMCFAAIDFAWIFFRASGLSEAVAIVKKILFEFNLFSSVSDKMIMLGMTKVQWLIMIAGLLIVLAVDILNDKKVLVSQKLKSLKTGFRWVLYLLFVCFMLWFSISNYGGAASNFIYTQF